jgi:hypothetical protein
MTIHTWVPGIGDQPVEIDSQIYCPLDGIVDRDSHQCAERGHRKLFVFMADPTGTEL